MPLTRPHHTGSASRSQRVFAEALERMRIEAVKHNRHGTEDRHEQAPADENGDQSARPAAAAIIAPRIAQPEVRKYQQ